MKYFTIFFALLVLFVGALFYSPAAKVALGLSCIQETVQENFDRADIVFTGVVTAISVREGNVQIGGDESGTITLRANKKWKGEVTQTMVLELGSFTSWYTTPKVGDEWLIFAQKENNKFTMPLCGIALEVSGARSELAFLTQKGSSTVGGGSTTSETSPPRPTTEGKQSCHQYAPGRVMSRGYGAPYNVFSNTLFMRAQCTTSTAEVTLGTGLSEEYVYNKGYYHDGTRWRDVSFTGSNANKNGAWFGKDATASIPITEFSPGEMVFVVGYVCLWRGSAGWKCGCADSACTKPSWQLQAITVPERGSTTGFQGCTMEAKICPDGTAVGRTGSNCSFAACPAAENITVSIGQQVGSFKLTKVHADKAEGLTYIMYPVARETGEPATIRLGDNVGIACEGISYTLIRLDVAKQQAVFSKVAGTRPAGGCPICLGEDTLIETPNGSRAVSELVSGDTVWTRGVDGKKIAAPVNMVSKVAVPQTHRLITLVFANDSRVAASALHPLANGQLFKDVRVGDTYEGSVVTEIQSTPYDGGFTYDLLPDSPTGVYFVDGVALGSTLAQ